MIDLDTVFTGFLKTAGTALYTLCGTRVYAPEAPGGYLAAHHAGALAVLEVFRRGGKPNSAVQEHAVSYQIKCFGGTTSHVQATLVERALYDLLFKLDTKVLSGGTIMSATQESIGQPLKDPDTGWPYVLIFWRVTMRPAA